jgi:hypothetical protein
LPELGSNFDLSKFENLNNEEEDNNDINNSNNNNDDDDDNNNNNNDNAEDDVNNISNNSNVVVDEDDDELQRLSMLASLPPPPPTLRPHVPDSPSPQLEREVKTSGGLGRNLAAWQKGLDGRDFEHGPEGGQDLGVGQLDSYHVFRDLITERH